MLALRNEELALRNEELALRNEELALRNEELALRNEVTKCGKNPSPILEGVFLYLKSYILDLKSKAGGDAPVD